MIDWQPIEAAPKDGSYVLLFYPTLVPPYEVARWRILGNDRVGWFFANRFWDEQPTAWAELNAPTGPKEDR